MNQRSGKVYLTNLQPQIKEMFEIMNGALPEWVFESRKQLEHYLDAMQESYADYRYMTKSEARMFKYHTEAESNSNQSIQQSRKI
jgi:hypothetical protein